MPTALLPNRSIYKDTTGQIAQESSRAWLESLPQSERNPVAQWTHRAAREGAKTAIGVLLGLALTIGERRGNAWSNPEEFARLDPVAQALTADTDAALDYARYVLWWETLPESDRQRIKQARSRTYQQQAMVGKPSTERQLTYLRSLGHVGPMPSTMAEASRLIDERRQP